jgi:Tfp pilus assembly protein PilE
MSVFQIIAAVVAVAIVVAVFLQAWAIVRLNRRSRTAETDAQAALFAAAVRAERWITEIRKSRDIPGAAVVTELRDAIQLVKGCKE